MKLKGKTLLAYVAGIIDGEGSISLAQHKRKDGRRTHWELIVAVCNTKFWLIEFLHFQFGGYIDERTQYGINYANAKKSWRWTMCASKAGDFLKLVLPYLQLKKPQAELAIAFQDRRTHNTADKSLVNKRRIMDEIDFIAMRAWNKRGKEVNNELDCRNERNPHSR